MNDLLHEGIAAAKAGQRDRARELLMHVVEQDEENALAWLWLSGVVDSLDDREICLENVLALDPDNDVARKGLAFVRKQKEIQAPSSAETMPPSASLPESPVAARAERPATLAAAILRDDFARRRPPPEPEPEPPPTPPQDEFDNPYLCPYCAAQTYPDDRKCQACGAELWIRIRRREERSSWLWAALTLQMAGIIWPATVPLLMLIYAAREVGVDNPLTLMPVYLGLSGSVPPKVASAVLEAVPRLYFLVPALYVLFSLGVLVGLYLRWKPIFFMFLISALLALVLGGAGMLLGQGVGLICSGSGVILAILMFFMLLQLEDDFFFDEKRILLRVDRSAKKGLDFLASGRRYMRRKMWAMAVIHLRRAASWLPDWIDSHLELAAAYLGLKRYDLAAKALAEARRIDPDDSRVEELTALLNSLRPTDSSP
ncbi:MAG: tetratricopeptide repeat protein [Anaerolineae bacterium]